MLPLVTVDEMRWCDETTIRKIGIPGVILMENAAAGVAQYVEKRFGPLKGEHVMVVCGKGNNAGDGFVVARHLHSAGAGVQVLMVASPRELKGDARTNFMILQRIAKENRDSLRIARFGSGKHEVGLQSSIIIDALFGTGFTGKPKKPYAVAIEWMNKLRAPIVSVDIPSGVNGTTGIAEGPAVKAKATITLGLPKIGLFCNQARDLVGELHVVDIGIPSSVVQRGRFKTFFVEPSDVSALLPQRPSVSHKYSIGKVLVIAGSKGYTGAAALCAEGALRAGAGAVVLCTPESIYPVLARKLTEVIVEPVPATSDGSLALSAKEKLKERIRWADVVIVGPGLSRNDETQELLRQLIAENKTRMLVDADALAAIRDLGISKLRKSKGEFILTPHAGEMSRLIGTPSNEIEMKRVEVGRAFARRTRQTLVLKGAPTVTATGDERVYVNSTGNPGMATVGSGDVLAGIIASLWAQGVPQEQAAVAGVYLHGLAGDLAAKKLGMASLVAHDLIDFLPVALQKVEGRGLR